MGRRGAPSPLLRAEQPGPRGRSDNLCGYNGQIKAAAAAERGKRAEIWQEKQNSKGSAFCDGALFQNHGRRLDCL